MMVRLREMGFLFRVLERFGEIFKKGVFRVAKMGKVAWMGLDGNEGFGIKRN